MPITKSAKKSLRVSRTKKVQNDVYRKNLEIALKKVDGKNVSSVISLIDKTAKVGIIAKGKANRMKSQLAKKFGTPKIEKSKKKIENSVVKNPVVKKKQLKELRPKNPLRKLVLKNKAK